MEVTGVESMFACASCVCALCTRGPIHPNSTHDCPNNACMTCNDGKPVAKTSCSEMKK